MLAKKFHFSTQRAPRQNPRTYRSRYFVFREQSNNLPFSRFGVVVSRAVQRKATGRNKIKRIIFDFIRLKKLHLKPGQDVLIITLPQAAGLGEKEIQAELTKFLDNQKI